MQHSQAHDSTSRHDVRHALNEIIEGTNVKRSKHELMHEGVDLTSMFIEELGRRGYHPHTVGDVRVQPGERAPGFLVESHVAYFGWVFWEQFTSWKIRKLWGSVIKNGRGDWEHQVPAGKKTIVYVNESLMIEMDIDHPPEF